MPRFNARSGDANATDLAITRERIWVRTNQQNRFGNRVLIDTGWDSVQYDGLPSGFEPGTDNFEQRRDGLKSDRKYTGILSLDEGDALAIALLKSGGRGAF